MEWSGKRWLTGASSGIGAATAEAAAKRGAELALVARLEDKLEAVAQRIRERGGRVTTHAFDVSDAEQVARLATEVPTPDVLFNNAGAGRWKPLLETNPAEAAEMVGAPYPPRTRRSARSGRRRGSSDRSTSVAASAAPDCVVFITTRNDYSRYYVDDRKYFTLATFYDEIGKP